MHALVQLAKDAVEEFVIRRKVLPPPHPLPPELTEKAGVFVCIKKRGDLRGCIGTFSPCCENIAAEIIRNAVSCAARDPRFLPVTEDELPDLEYTVDVLASPEKVADVSELNPKEYGVILTSGPKRGLLLPDLEGVDTAEEQLRITRLKAGILSGERVEMFRFRVRRYK